MFKRSLFLVLLGSIFLSLLLAACGAGGGSGSSASDAAGNADNGQKLFTSGKGSAAACAGCHSIKPNEKLVGPSLAGISGQAATIIKDPNYKGNAKDAAGYIHESIVEPNAYVVPGFPPNVMPANYGKDLSGQEINDLVAYLMTLK